MKLLKDPPYGHAIPIRIYHQNISILYDCPCEYMGSLQKEKTLKKE